MPGIGYGTAPTPDGKSLLVALIRNNQLGLVDLGRMQFVKGLEFDFCPLNSINTSETQSLMRTGLFRALPRPWFEPSARDVAPRLIGQWLIRRTDQGLCGGQVVETEAYIAGDPACHAAPGLTRRNRVMFGPPGHAYVYFIYGCHFCVNVVCQPQGLAEAVLIRAIEPSLGLEILRQNRPTAELSALTNGPGRLCQAMDICRELDGADLCDVSGPLFVAANENLGQFLAAHGPVAKSTRVGLSKAADLELRFYLRDHSFVSRRNLRRVVGAAGSPRAESLKFSPDLR